MFGEYLPFGEVGGLLFRGKDSGFRVACKGVQGFSFEVYMLGVQNAAKNPTTISLFTKNLLTLETLERSALCIPLPG